MAKPEFKHNTGEGGLALNKYASIAGLQSSDSSHADGKYEFDEFVVRVWWLTRDVNAILRKRKPQLRPSPIAKRLLRRRDGVFCGTEWGGSGRLRFEAIWERRLLRSQIARRRAELRFEASGKTDDGGFAQRSHGGDNAGLRNELRTEERADYGSKPILETAVCW